MQSCSYFDNVLHKELLEYDMALTNQENYLREQCELLAAIAEQVNVSLDGVFQDMTDIEAEAQGWISTGRTDMQIKSHILRLFEEMNDGHRQHNRLRKNSDEMHINFNTIVTLNEASDQLLRRIQEAELDNGILLESSKKRILTRSQGRTMDDLRQLLKKTQQLEEAVMAKGESIGKLLNKVVIDFEESTYFENFSSAMNCGSSTLADDVPLFPRCKSLL